MWDETMRGETYWGLIRPQINLPWLSSFLVLNDLISHNYLGEKFLSLFLPFLMTECHVLHTNPQFHKTASLGVIEAPQTTKWQHCSKIKNKQWIFYNIISWTFNLIQHQLKSLNMLLHLMSCRRTDKHWHSDKNLFLLGNGISSDMGMERPSPWLHPYLVRSIGSIDSIPTSMSSSSISELNAAVNLWTV
jgi:hypothetical protein